MKKMTNKKVYNQSLRFFNRIISLIGIYGMAVFLFNRQYNRQLLPIKVRKSAPKFLIISFCLLISGFNASAIELSAVCLPEGNKLEWVTTAENSSRGFTYEIERKSSLDADFQLIDVVSSTTRMPVASYKYFDNQVSGAATYRLKLVDEDGSITFSPEVYIERQVIILPVSLCQQRSAIVLQPEIRLYTQSGKEANARVVVCHDNRCEVDVAHIPAGVYVVKIKIGKRRYTQHVTIKK